MTRPAEANTKRAEPYTRLIKLRNSYRSLLFSKGKSLFLERHDMGDSFLTSDFLVAIVDIDQMIAIISHA